MYARQGLYKLSDNSRTSVLFFIETVFSHYKDINYFKIFSPCKTLLPRLLPKRTLKQRAGLEI